ncbi:uncharacterized protein N7484_007048 [Penicillium longicatenatum]|uniref:uncharacterized protein n=1 Tax=Penicillium longicatenatum TaxID=1561947 RepID=UPI002548518E|nr:uncharacterized protein N7484_007048 [Penicillium longicatenatum]KAJ5639186.1 hypothetical protein N7484_007048 [Penicillium longicatenatum]
MTIAVLAAPITKVKRRELGTIAMAATQAQSRPGRGRPPKRLSASQEGLEEIANHAEAKRKANYEEDSEGFRFSRKPTKRNRPSIEPVPDKPQSDVENAPPKSTPRRGRPPKKRPAEDESASAVPTNGKTTELPTRRGTRKVAKTGNSEPEPPVNSTRSLRNHESPSNAPAETKGKRGRPGRPRTSDTNGFKSPEPPAGTKVALPLADTPVIQRNKELRGTKSGKGQRRSSLGMRGRRASSLIDSGASNALPHREVGTADFYKHIADEGLPEPRRMRQLLIWCATRALGDKPSGSRSVDQSSRLAARAIQDELLKDFSTNSELSNWFSREDVNPPTVVVKKPNPRNIQNTEKIKELEEHIQRLQKERHALNALLKQAPIPPVNAPTPDSPQASKRYPKKSQPQIDSSLLDPSQQAILTSLYASVPAESQAKDDTSPPILQTPMSPSTVSNRLSQITTGLAPTLDAFAAGIHDIELYSSSADALSSRILRICAERLEDRDALNTRRRIAIEGDGEGESPQKLRERPREDLGLILGALSRVERR